MARLRNVHKQLAASRAFAALPDTDQKELEAIHHADRTPLYDEWKPTDADVAAARTTPLARFYDEICLLRPDLTLQLVFGEDSATVTVSRSAEHKVTVDGFDRHGDRTDDWNPFTAAAEIAEALPKQGEI